LFKPPAETVSGNELFEDQITEKMPATSAKDILAFYTKLNSELL